MVAKEKGSDGLHRRSLFLSVEPCPAEITIHGLLVHASFRGFVISREFAIEELTVVISQTFHGQTTQTEDDGNIDHQH